MFFIVTPASVPGLSADPVHPVWRGNLHSILLLPYLAGDTPDALAGEAEEELRSLFALCQRLLQTDGTRILFTSREKLPAPFDDERNRRELHRLATEEGRGTGGTGVAQRKKGSGYRRIRTGQGPSSGVAFRADACVIRPVGATRWSPLQRAIRWSRSYRGRSTGRPYESNRGQVFPFSRHSSPG
uniref:Uncharacterized protein n=1 Tax=Candidatus Kentrum sp. FW TaxID=2126338 RepID=A0A450SIN4_9GAMM|nr:MAG: hypothetical protein BECKFW1821B_GA0114236_101426 [Candidatus Kentron sp. FW]